ncbi:MAG: hypothetical protein ACI4F9_06985 [Lachnospiraceae bacterium]
MTKYLWNFINTSIKGQWKVNIFLFLHMVCFICLSFLAEFLFCSVLGTAFIAKYALPLLALPLYIGLFVGLYGGIIFLMKYTNF